MDTFKINIEKHGGIYHVYTNRGKEYLMSFFLSNYDNSTWFFDIPEKQTGTAWVYSKEIPVANILEFAKAVIVIRYGVTDFNIEMTVASKKLLDIK